MLHAQTWGQVVSSDFSATPSRQGDENRATNRQDPKRGGRAAPGPLLLAPPAVTMQRPACARPMLVLRVKGVARVLAGRDMPCAKLLEMTPAFISVICISGDERPGSVGGPVC